MFLAAEKSDKSESGRTGPSSSDITICIGV